MMKAKIILITLILTNLLSPITINAEEQKELELITQEIITDFEVTVPDVVIKRPNIEEPHKPGTETQNNKLGFWFLPKEMNFAVKVAGTEKKYEIESNDEFGYRVAVVNIDHNVPAWFVTARLDQIDQGQGMSINWVHDSIYSHDNPSVYKESTLLNAQITKENIQLLAGDNAVKVFANKDKRSQGYYSTKLSKLHLLVPGKVGKINQEIKTKIIWSLDTEIEVGA